MPAKGTSKKKTTAQKQKEAQKAQLRAKQQLWAIVVFAFAVLLFFITLIQGQNVWLWMHNLILGIFGWSAYLIAPIFLYIAIMTTLDKPIGLVGHKVWQTLVLVCLLSGATQVFGGGIPSGNLIGKISALFRDGIQLQGGGAISAIFGLPLLHWFGEAGAKITMVLLIFVFAMILTGGTLVGLYQSAKRPVKKLEEAYLAHAGEREQQRAAEQASAPPPAALGSVPKARQKGFDINIPLDESTVTPAPDLLEDAPLPQSASFAKAKERKKAQLEQQQQQEEPYLDDLISRVMGPESDGNPQPPLAGEDQMLLSILDGDRVVSPVTDLSDGAAALERLGDALENPEQLPWEEPVHPREEHEIIQVPPEELSAQGITREGVSHSVGRPVELDPLELTDGQPEEEPEIQYVCPPVELLNEIEQKGGENLQEELKANAEKLVSTLQSFGVQTRIIDIARGPAVTRYELQPSAGVKISKITNLADDIALNLAASGVRIEAPIPGKPAVGIEIPNKTVSTVSIREMIDSHQFQEAQSFLSVALGRDIGGQITLADLAKMPHVLIAGSTGSGKSVCINSLIVSMLYKSTPREVRMLLIDPKMVELGIYNGIPHLLVPVVTDPKKAAGALAWAVNEMLNRYQMFKDNSVRDLSGYNRLAQQKGFRPMPQIVIIIDELADLMMAAPGEVEDSICRLAQMARAAGMHLVIATQRPSVDVITGVIKANIPSRIAFAVSSQIDSRTILDSAGAEKLLGRGDMLFSPVGASKPTRVQGCFVTDGEVERLVEFIKRSTQKLTYDQRIIEEIDRQAVSEKKKGGKEDGGGFEDEDEMLPSAIECAVEMGQVSTSMLQRKLKLGYARAARIMDAMESKGVIGPQEGSKPRQVLITKERWIEMKLCAAQRAEDNRRNY